MIYTEENRGADIIVAQPNRSADWRTNRLVLIFLSVISGAIAVGFALLGAWPILPFAGLEMTALGCALYYVCWKLNYRHVITVEQDRVRIQKGHFYPREEWSFTRSDTALSVVPEQHPWSAPSIALYSKGEEIQLGEFLNRDEALELVEHLKRRMRVGNDSRRDQQTF